MRKPAPSRRESGSIFRPGAEENVTPRAENVFERLTPVQARQLSALMERAVAEERAACAAIALAFAERPDGAIAIEIATRIRARIP
jgi:hypothetical protein